MTKLIIGPGRYVRKGLVAGTYQIIVDAFVQFPLVATALPHLLVVVLQAFPVGSELFKTVRVDILDTASCYVLVRWYILYPMPPHRESPFSLLACGPPSASPTAVCTLKSERGFFTRSYTHTLLAHLVTLRPSFRHSISPLPGFSVLHFMKSSL